MIWTPLRRPPDPKSISGFSSETEQVWEALLNRHRSKEISKLLKPEYGTASYYRSIYEDTFGPQHMSRNKHNKMPPANTAAAYHSAEASKPNLQTDYQRAMYSQSSVKGRSFSQENNSPARSIYPNRMNPGEQSISDRNSIGYEIYDKDSAERRARTLEDQSEMSSNSMHGIIIDPSRVMITDNCNVRLPDRSPVCQITSSETHSIMSSPPLDLSPGDESYLALSQLTQARQTLNRTENITNAFNVHILQSISKDDQRMFKRQKHMNQTQEVKCTDGNINSGNFDVTASSIQPGFIHRPKEKMQHQTLHNLVVDKSSKLTEDIADDSKENVGHPLKKKSNQIARKLHKLKENFPNATGCAVKCTEDNNSFLGPEKKQRKITSFSAPYKPMAIRKENDVASTDSEEAGCYKKGPKAKLDNVADMTSTERGEIASALLAASDVTMCLMFSDKSTQLRASSLPSQVESLVLAYVAKNESKNRLRCILLPLRGLSTESQLYQYTRRCVEELLQTCRVRKLCYEAQNTIRTLLNLFQYHQPTVCNKWTVIDPKIGQWLLDPDKPPSAFSDVLKHHGLQQNQNLSDWENEVQEDLSLLAEVTVAIHNQLTQKGMCNLWYNMETPLIPQLACMETRGVKVAVEEMSKNSALLKAKRSHLEQQALKAAGQSFNINSHPQLRMILFEKLKLDSKLPKRRSTTVHGNKSTSEAVLLQLQDVHPLPQIVLQHRQLQKLASTYVDGLLSCVKDGKLHTHWDHTAAATGRLTSCNPNIQSIPKQAIDFEQEPEEYMVGKASTKVQIFARAPFISEEGQSFLAADFRQIELRILAHLSNEDSLLKLFNKNSGSDVFVDLTCQWLGKKPSEVTSTEREQSKRVVYSVMYGVGKDRLASYLNTSPAQAQALMQSFMVAFPGVGAFTRACVAEARIKGYTSTLFGRRRLFPHITHAQFQVRAQAERQAVNFCIQGTAADLCKRAMLELERRLYVTDQLCDVQLLYQIHDELLLHVPDSCLTETAQLVRKVMENSRALCGQNIELRVPLSVSVSAGKSWAHLTVID